MLSYTDIQRMYGAANVEVTHPLRTLYSLCLRPEMYGVPSSNAHVNDIYFTTLILLGMHCEAAGMDFDARRAFIRRLDDTKTYFTSSFSYLNHIQETYADEFRVVKAWIEEREKTP